MSKRSLFLNRKFNESFDKFILPKYLKGQKPFPKPIEIDEDHVWAIQDRKVFRHICTTVDPEGCVDADDGFSIYVEPANGVNSEDKENLRLFLAIHIADPTHYITPESKLFKVICSNVVTHYPSMWSAVHLMPHDIVTQASLTSYMETGEYKNAISLVMEIDMVTYLPKGVPKLEFTIVKVTPNTKFSYNQAARYLPPDFKIDLTELTNINNTSRDHMTQVFNVSYLISRALSDSRLTIGKPLEHFRSNLKYVNGGVVIYEDPKPVKDMKSVIAEFAILYNSFIGEYLSKHTESSGTVGIYRACDTSALDKEFKNSEPSNITGEQLMEKIVKTGTSAKYTQSGEAHGLVGASKYTHFTSPIRRVSDCVSHYLIKYLHYNMNLPLLGVKPPFTAEYLDTLTDHIDKKSKIERRLQFDDVKFRTIQSIAGLVINTTYVNLGVKFASSSFKTYKDKHIVDGKEVITENKVTYINLIIKKINDFNVSVSYTIRFYDYPKAGIDALKQYDGSSDEYLNVKVYRINVPKKFDQGTFPELDKTIKMIPYMKIY